MSKIRLRVGTEGKAAYYGETIPDVSVTIEGLVQDSMTLKELIATYVLPALEHDVEAIVDRRRNRFFGKLWEE